MKEHSTESRMGEQSYRHLLKHLPICILVLDLTVSPAVILDVNRRTELVYGYSAAELVGKSAAELVAEESREIVQNIVQRVRLGETVTAETMNRHRDGTAFPVRVISTLDPANNGRMIAAVEDITAEKQRRSEAEAIDAERLRIAREIHDGVAQNLAGLRFKTALWSHLPEGASPAMSGALAELQYVLMTTITDLRRAIFALRPLDLETLGFLPALTQLVTDFGEQNQITAQLDISGHSDGIPTIYELPLFRIIQESLNNINQHARATSVFINITVDPNGSVKAVVRDNGQGFCPDQMSAANPSRHFGLRQMRERVWELGGTLDVCSTIGRGTELLITLPAVTKEGKNASD